MDKKGTINYPKSAAVGFFFQGTQERVRNSRGKRAISVRAIEVLLYIDLKTGYEEKLWQHDKTKAPACNVYHIQSTLVISKLKGPYETVRDIRTSTYQNFKIEDNTNRTTKFHK